MDKEKVVLITGGATALAREVAIALSANYKIIIHYNKSEEEAKKVAETIGEERCKIIQADFNKVSAKSFFKEALSQFSTIDVVINAASIFEKTATEDVSRESVEKFFNIHSTFPLLLTVELFNHLNNKKKTGVVINITDAQLEKNTKNRVPYYLSKQSLSYQSKILASEFAPVLRVNEVAPGFTLAKEWEEEYFKKVNDVLPFKVTKVEQVIKAIEFFIKSDQVSGQRLVVDSGLTLLNEKLV